MYLPIPNRIFIPLLPLVFLVFTANQLQSRVSANPEKLQPYFSFEEAGFRPIPLAELNSKLVTGSEALLVIQNESESIWDLGSQTILCGIHSGEEEKIFPLAEIPIIRLKPGEKQLVEIPWDKINSQLQEGEQAYLYLEGDSIPFAAIVILNGIPQIQYPAQNYPWYGGMLDKFFTVIVVFGAFLVGQRRYTQKAQYSRGSNPGSKGLTHIETLIAEDRVGEALEQLRSQINKLDPQQRKEIIGLQSEWNRVSRERLNGLIDEENYGLVRSRIVVRVLEICGNLNKKIA
jgi:hypothetical protein